MAIWSTVPLTIRLLTTLKRRRGVYFYSILVTSWGLSIRQVGDVLQFLVPSCPWILSNGLAQGGWVAMVSGFSMVLYSRLNIILESLRMRRVVLAMIVTNGVVFHIAMITLSIGLAALSHGDRHEKAQTPAWRRVFQPMERVQIIVFSAQETAISFFYVRAAYQYLKSRFAQRGKTQRAMFLLLLVQVIIIAIDIALIAIDFAGLLQLKLFIHSFVYSVKLELEFVVLNQLVELSQLGVPGIPSFSMALRSEHSGEAIVKMPAWTPESPDPGPESVRSEKSERNLEFITEPGSRDESHNAHVLSMPRIGTIPSA